MWKEGRKEGELKAGFNRKTKRRRKRKLLGRGVRNGGEMKAGEKEGKKWGGKIRC